MSVIPAMAERIELWPVDRLQPYARNARTHSDEQVAKIAASMTEFGFTNPILVDGSDGIIAGHGRLMAAQRLGLDEVPVVVLDHLTEAQRRAYILADNRLALDAGWDWEMLRSEMEDIRDIGEFDLSVIGFDDKEIDAMFMDRQEGENDADAEWNGMPEFNQQDQTAYKKLTINFACQAHVDQFAELIGQKITDKTRSIWHPPAEIGTYADKLYAEGDGENDEDEGGEDAEG